MGAGFSAIVRRAPVLGFRRRYDEGLTKGRPRPWPLLGGLLAAAVVVVDCRLAPPAAGAAGAANGGCGTRPGDCASCAPGDGARRREDSSSLRCCCVGRSVSWAVLPGSGAIMCGFGGLARGFCSRARGGGQSLGCEPPRVSRGFMFDPAPELGRREGSDVAGEGGFYEPYLVELWWVVYRRIPRRRECRAREPSRRGRRGRRCRSSRRRQQGPGRLQSCGRRRRCHWNPWWFEGSRFRSSSFWGGGSTGRCGLGGGVPTGRGVKSRPPGFPSC